MTEEALRMVVLEWLQTSWAPEKERDVRDTVNLFRYDSVFDQMLVKSLIASCDHVPDSAQAHLLSGKLSWSLHAVVLTFSLQIHVEADTQARNLIGQELVSWARTL